MPKRFLLVFFLLTSTTFAKTHEDYFQAPCENVWTALRQVLMHSGKYGVLFMSNEDMTASYNIGGGLGGKRTNSVQLKPRGVGCTLSVQTAFTGLAHNDAGDFLARVKKALAEVPTSKNSESAGRKPSPGSAPEPATGATLEISSTPAGADIEVDGNFAGNTPSSVGVMPGEHTIKVTKRGYTPWERKVKTTTGTVKISPELEAIAQSK